MRRAFLLLAAAGLWAQETPFSEDGQSWWKPTGSLRAEREDFRLKTKGFRWDRLRLRLKWDWELAPSLHLQTGSFHSLSSAPNRKDLTHLENQRSNGSYLDLAALRWMPAGESLGGELSGGLVENPLLAGESLWDPNLRIWGGAGRMFWRSERVQELGLRAVAGNARLIQGGRVPLKAAQAVLRFDTGPLQWTFHGGYWRMEPRQKDAAGGFLRENPGRGITIPDPYGFPTASTDYLTPLFQYRVAGLGLASQGPLPFEIKAQRQERTDGAGRGEELQVWIGSPRRPWWPQAAWIRQRLDAQGALASVNGDQWWFHAAADGSLYILALNLPKPWRLEARRLEQIKRGSGFTTTRNSVAVSVKF